jgi:hypothetical protein
MDCSYRFSTPSIKTPYTIALLSGANSKPNFAR